jgi:hypothetical protein
MVATAAATGATAAAMRLHTLTREARTAGAQHTQQEATACHVQAGVGRIVPQHTADTVALSVCWLSPAAMLPLAATVRAVAATALRGAPVESHPGQTPMPAAELQLGSSAQLTAASMHPSCSNWTAGRLWFDC